ncbi:porin [Ruegeria arenilitoris]|uniref:porin n=1 Tax=Ruegeria arenilitoris TaxID=1173585 RepID=UPI00147F2F36|nr:porin [Ruegeria arenilitoris]
MKKVLFASTALIATAGVAAAESGINFSGYGRFGIGYQEDRSFSTSVQVVNPDGTDLTTVTATTEGDDAILVSRFRLNIDGFTETDGGVRFEGRVRLQADENPATGEANNADLNAARFSVIYGGLRVDAGNVAGSFDNLANYYGNEVGLELFAGQYSGVNYSFLSYQSGDSDGSNAVFFQYAVGDFAFGASYDQKKAVTRTLGVGVDDDGDPIRTLTATSEDADRWDVSLTYAFNNITAAVAYGENDDDGASGGSLTVLTLGAEFGDFNGTLFVADDDVNDAAKNGTAWGLSAAYNLGAATTLLFAYGDGNADEDKQQIALGAIYDLGGGASLRGGVGRNDTDGEDQWVADFGAQFNF